MGKPFYKESVLYRVPLYIFFATSLCLQFYHLAKTFSLQSRRKVASLVCKLTMPFFFHFQLCYNFFLFYPMYNKQNRQGKLFIAVFVSVIAVIAKAISRICVQRLWNITHPGYSYVLLVPLYLSLAVLC